MFSPALHAAADQGARSDELWLDSLRGLVSTHAEGETQGPNHQLGKKSGTCDSLFSSLFLGSFVTCCTRMTALSYGCIAVAGISACAVNMKACD